MGQQVEDDFNIHLAEIENFLGGIYEENYSFIHLSVLQLCRSDV